MRSRGRCSRVQEDRRPVVQLFGRSRGRSGGPKTKRGEGLVNASLNGPGWWSLMIERRIKG